MKQIIYLTIFIFLANCSTHSVKLGKRCTKIAEDNTYEKSLIWLIGAFVVFVTYYLLAASNE